MLNVDPLNIAKCESTNRGFALHKNSNRSNSETEIQPNISDFVFPLTACHPFFYRGEKYGSVDPKIYPSQRLSPPLRILLISNESSRMVTQKARSDESEFACATKSWGAFFFVDDEKKPPVR